MKKLNAITRANKLEPSDSILAQIQKRISPSSSGGGKVFVTEIPHAMRIRIGQRGEDAH